LKITKIDVFQVSSPDNPVWRPVLCRVYTDKGIYGDGEAAMAYGVASAGAFGMVQELANLVIGMNPLENEVIWQKMYRSTFWGQNGGGVFTAAMNNTPLHPKASKRGCWNTLSMHRKKKKNVLLVLSTKKNFSKKSAASPLSCSKRQKNFVLKKLPPFVMKSPDLKKQFNNCTSVLILFSYVLI
jgi:hypothetical protein